MRLKLSWCAAALALVGQLGAQTPGGTAAAALPTEKALLWSIQRPDVKKTSYLYGTIHLISAKDFFLLPSTLKALQRAKKVVFEINLSNLNSNFGDLAGMLNQSFMANDTTLEDLLSPADYALVAAQFNSLGLPMNIVNRIKPMLLTAMDPGDLAEVELGTLNDELADMVSYELELLELAQRRRKPIGGLETIADQLGLFDSIPYRAQANMLVNNLKEKGDRGKNDELTQLGKIYREQDIQKMQEFIQDSEMKVYEQLLLTNRNRRWIPKMTELMAQGTTLFAVGAGHLGGEQGLIVLLRQQGYQVEPIYR